MAEGTRSIGALARESGLSVSALRFYDAAGVLPPARVDAVTGYRWYSADQVSQARLIASLRRVSMPLTEICDVLAVRHDPVQAEHLLDAYICRLEDALIDARGQLDLARDLLAHQEKPMTRMTVFGADLAAALSAVRFAVSDDPELPALNGVLFDYDGSTLRLVATDRYRLAVATLASRDQLGPAVQVIAPLSLIDDLTAAPDDDISLRLDHRSLTIAAAHAEAITAVFPNYQRLLRTTPEQQVSVTTVDVRDRLAAGPTRTMMQAPNNALHEVSVVLLTDQRIDVLEHDHPDAVGFNREFLLQALDASSADQLVLALDGPIGPLAILDPDRPDDISLLMPTRLDRDRGTRRGPADAELNPGSRSGHCRTEMSRSTSQLPASRCAAQPVDGNGRRSATGTARCGAAPRPIHGRLQVAHERRGRREHRRHRQP